MVERILQKHEYNLSQYKVVNQVINRALKRIGQLAGIDDKIEKVVYRNGKAVKTYHKKYELITTHTARRSFATNAYHLGADLLSIMNCTGHKTPEMLLKYINVSAEEHSKKLASVFQIAFQ